MGEVDYCPNCNKLASQYLNKCAYCESKTIKLHAETDKFGAQMLITFSLTILLFLVFIIVGVFDNMFIDVIIGAVLFSFLLVGSIYYFWNKHKPILEEARKRGYQLYLDNKDAYNNEEEIIDPETPPPPTEFPWSIRNVHKMRMAFFICAALIPVPFLLSTFFISWSSRSTDILFTLALTMIFFMSAILINMSNAPARRYSELFKALKLKPDEIKLIFSSLGVKSRVHGNFDMKYDSENGYYLRVPLDPELKDSIQEAKIWDRPNIVSKLSKKHIKTESKYLPMIPLQLETLKSLKLIRIEDRQLSEAKKHMNDHCLVKFSKEEINNEEVSRRYIR